MTKVGAGTGTRDGLNLTHSMKDRIGRDIVTGQYDQVAFPIEAILAAEHGVSRSVVREAVKMLGAKGLLTGRPRKGTTVQPARSWNLVVPDVLRWLLERKFTLELLRHFTELRVAIEPAAAALTARVHDDIGLGQIRAGYLRMVAAEAGEDDSLDADIAFHVAILEASENPFFRQFRDLVDTALRTSIRFTNRYVGRTADLEQHKAVLDAIERGDAAGAEAAMGNLIADVQTLIASAEQER